MTRMSFAVGLAVALLGCSDSGYQGRITLVRDEIAVRILEPAGTLDDNQALREVMGASIKGAEPHAPADPNALPIAPRTSGDPGADLDNILRALGVEEPTQ